MPLKASETMTRPTTQSWAGSSPKPAKLKDSGLLYEVAFPISSSPVEAFEPAAWWMGWSRSSQRPGDGKACENSTTSRATRKRFYLGRHDQGPRGSESSGQAKAVELQAMQTSSSGLKPPVLWNLRLDRAGRRRLFAGSWLTPVR